MQSVHDPERARRRAARALFMALAMLALAAAAAAGEWRGRVVEAGGATRIENPREPMAGPRTVALEELWRLGGDSDDENQFFGLLAGLDVDAAGNLYLLDAQLHVVKVFAPDGAYLRSLGREGEGPGEFRRPAGLFVRDDGVVGVAQGAPGKIVLIHPDGTPAGEFPLPQTEEKMQFVYGARAAGEDLLVVLAGNTYTPGKINQLRRLARVAPDGTEKAVYTTGLRVLDMEQRLVEETMWGAGFEQNWLQGDDGTVYAMETWGEYAISAWPPGGGKRIVTRDLPARRRTDAELDEVREIMQVFINHFQGSRPVLSETAPRVFSYYVLPGGSLWVQNDRTLQDLPAGALGVFDVFDAQGRFVRQVTLTGEGHPRRDALAFLGGRLFVLKGSLEAAVAAEGGGADVAEAGSEAEAMSVICYRLPGELEELTSP
ncbi:MAG: hypothetical protein JW819_06520 [Candidatus Krumholzibacteriota bacterium]|nr:hypothetical protein [Candidatus Krumholzibacteriota bacterium]